MSSDRSTLNPLDEVILREHPYPIAANYRRVLDAQDWRTCVGLDFRLFEYGLHTIAVSIASQYGIRDAVEVSNPNLNNLLRRKLPRGYWYYFVRSYLNRIVQSNFE